MRVTVPTIPKVAMPNDLEEAGNTTAHTDIYVPTTAKGVPLPAWDGNWAKVLGLLFDCNKHYRDNALFQAWIKHRAVQTSYKTSVQHIHTGYFLTGEIEDEEPHSLLNLCPAIATRIAKAQC